MFLFDTLSKKTTMPTQETALPGREAALAVPEAHFVNGRPLKGPYPDGLETIYLGMGCFWGAERLFWKTPGVWVTAVGYAGGFTRNPTYQETTTGQTGHAEVVKVVYDPAVISLSGLLKIFLRSTIRRRACDRATMSARPIVPPSTRRRKASCSRRRRPAMLFNRLWRRLAMAVPSPPRSGRLKSFITLKTIISNILPRTRVATAASGERA